MRALPKQLAGAAVALVVAVAPVRAQISWADWTSTGSNTVSGTMMFGSTTVGVTYSGPYFTAQTACGTDYWYNPTTYQGTGVPNAPTNCEIIELSEGGLKTISFSSPVVDPVFAFVSWNGQPTTGVAFNGMLELVNQGTGYWGTGSATVSGNTFFPVGEAHGTLRLLGTYSQIQFTDGSEGWHGFTVGAVGVAGPIGSTVPEPSTYVLMGTGLLTLFGVRWRRRSR